MPLMKLLLMSVALFVLVPMSLLTANSYHRGRNPLTKEMLQRRVEETLGLCIPGTAWP